MLVLYDTDCGFCVWTLSWVLRWDRARILQTAPIQSLEGEARLGGLEPAARLASWHVVDERGRLFSAGPALTQVLRRLPGGGALAALTARAPRVTQRAYEAVAANRTALSRPVSARAKARGRALVAAREKGTPCLRLTRSPTSPAGSCRLGGGGSAPASAAAPRSSASSASPPA